MQSRKERKEGNHGGKPRKEAKEGNQGKEITFVPRDDGDHLAEVVVEDARQLLRAHAALARQQRRQRGEARNVREDHGRLSVGNTKTVRTMPALKIKTVFKTKTVRTISVGNIKTVRTISVKDVKTVRTISVYEMSKQ